MEECVTFKFHCFPENKETSLPKQSNSIEAYDWKHFKNNVHVYS